MLPEPEHSRNGLMTDENARGHEVAVNLFSVFWSEARFKDQTAFVSRQKV
jgi:hypothetical protein